MLVKRSIIVADNSKINNYLAPSSLTGRKKKQEDTQVTITVLTSENRQLVYELNPAVYVVCQKQMVCADSVCNIYSEV